MSTRNLISLLVASVIVLFCFDCFPISDITKNRAEAFVKYEDKVLKRLPLPNGYHEGLYHDGKSIWVCNGKGGGVWEIDPDSGNVVSEVSPVGGFAEALIPDGEGAYWLTDWEDKMLYGVEIIGGKMYMSRKISLAPANPAGMIRNDEGIYVVTWTRGMGTKYHLLKLNDEGDIVETFKIKNIHEPAHLAWDGSAIWISSWYSKKIYKLDMKEKSITGFFDSPAEKTTGIVWHDGVFWVTGTHADLYKVKITAEEE